MPHGITKVLVDSVVRSLNDKAERLLWARRYEFVPGSNANGVKHTIQTRLPNLEHPTDLQMFSTLSKTYRYLLAMGQVLNDALSERDRQRRVAIDPGRTTGTVTFDPDARSARRFAEAHADMLSRSAGADQ